jgi:glycerophosphoryl diester phosphodiesterase
MRKSIVLIAIWLLGVVLFSGAAVGADRAFDRHIVVVAHRGAISGFPENTLVAFNRALEMGVDIIELDLRTTKDGIIVICHDDSVDRTTNGEGFVVDYTLTELRQLDAGSHAGDEFAGESIPTLEEVLDLMIPRGGKLLLDIKGRNEIDCEAIVQMIEQHGAVLDVILGVRSVEDAQLFRKLSPNIRQLGFISSATDMDEFAAAGVDILRLWARWIHSYAGFMDMAHELSKPVWVTSGFAGRDELEELGRLGADGFITDLPDVLIELMDEQHD